MLILGNLLWRTTGQGAPPPPPPVHVDTVIPSGGNNPQQGRSPAEFWRDQGVPESQESRELRIAKARARLGIPQPALEAILDVAARQAERLEQDAQKQLDELRGELKLRNLEIEAGYLQALAVERERLLDAEIATRLAAKLRAQENEALMLLVMIAAATV